MAEVDNKQVVFKSYITDGRAPTKDDMALTVSKLPDLKAPKHSGAFLLKNLYLSCDPYMRGRMRPPFPASYIPSFIPGQPIEGFGVSKVVDSDNPDYKPGDLIAGMTGWEEYSLIRKPQQMRKINKNDAVPLSYNLGLLGMPGFTAYCGLYDLCSPKAGDFVFVSAASGAVGQIVGQLAKLQGCYVVGSAGSTTKVDILKNKMGFDGAFNYKEELDLDQALKSMVSQNSVSDSGAGIRNISSIIPKRIMMQGFLQSDFLHLYPRFLELVTEHYLKGQIVYVEDMDDGLDRAPAALAGLFTGENVGKKVVRVASEE
ncbi:2-alkenal reductase (NADP(+)-dependent) [Linum perenne]